MRLYDNLIEAARECPERIALEFEDAGYTYAETADAARRVASGLRARGIEPQDSVGLMLPNLPEFVAVHYGSLMAGAVSVPMNVMLLGPEIEYLVGDSELKVLVIHEAFIEQVAAGIANLPEPPVVFVVGDQAGPFLPYADLLADADGFHPVETDEALPVMRMYTSGTTGKPKGAQLTGANVIANLEMMFPILPYEPGDKSLCVLPLFHCYALNGVLNAAIHHRTTTVLHRRFEPEACLRSLSEDGITSFAGVPTMYFQMLKNPDIAKAPFERLRWCLSGGAAMPVEVLNQWERTAQAPIYEGYGLTETTVSVCLNRLDRRKVGSIGLAYDRVQMRVVDDDDREVPVGTVGEIVIRGPNVMLGYLKKPKATEHAMRNGWFHTGDLGYRDADGFFFIVDRTKDMIIKGGFNIYPREIEEAIYQRPEVAEAAVIGIYDDAKGELVRAVVALKPNRALTEEQLREHLAGELAKYKLPNDYVILPELPKGPTGKILKRELRDRWDQWNKDRVIQQTAAEQA